MTQKSSSYRGRPGDLFLTTTAFNYLARIGLITALIVITILALIPPAQVPLASLGDKVLHFSAFLTLAALTDASFPKTPWNSRKLLSLLGYGLLLEIAQSFHPLRTFALDDMVADLAGLLLYIPLIPLLKRFPVSRLRWQQQ